MRKIISRGLLFIVMMMCLSVQAQSLKEFIDVALENNYQIQILKMEADIAKNNNTWGNAGKLPNIDIAGSNNTSFNSTKLRFADGTERSGKFAYNIAFNASVLANWTLFDGFRVQANKMQLELLERVGEMDSKFYIEQTIADIAAIYYQLIYENQLLESFKQTLAISSQRMKIEAKRREVGGGNALSYGIAEVDYQTDSIQYLAQENKIKSLFIEFNNLLSIDLESNIDLQEQLFDIAPILEKDALLESIKKNNKALELSRLGELLRETDQRIAKSDRYPKIDLFAGTQYAQSYSELGFVESSRNIGPVFGLSINYNLFNGGNTKRNIDNSEAYADIARMSRSQVNQQLDADILNLYHQYYSISDRISIAEANVVAMEKVFAIAEEQLKFGAINGFDFRTTQLSLVQSKIALEQLRFNLKSIEININRLSGNIMNAYL